MLLLLAHALLAAPQVSPEVILAGKRYQLTPVAEPVVVRSQRLLAPTGGVATRALDDLTIIEGAPASVARELLQRGDADEVLAVFETADRTRLYADSKVRVRFSAQTNPQRVDELVKAVGAHSARLVRGNTFEVLAPNAEAVIDIANRLAAYSEVVWAEPDFIVRGSLEAAPNDPLFPQQLHHELINSAAAWDIGQGASTMIIAVLDSGVDTTHPDLAAKIQFPRDTLRRVDTADPAANDAHGTACAGIATAMTNNGEGIAGVCPGCSLIPIRVLDQNGFTRASAGADAVRWAVDHGARVLSNSWGVNPVSSELSEAITYAVDAGALVFFASGNSGTTIADAQVAANPLVKAIGATNEYDVLAGYSNYGPQIVLTAPAAGVVTDIADRRGYTSGAYYTGFAGTSASTPVVAGLAALVWSQNPSLTAPQVLQILIDGADQIGELPYTMGRNDEYGAGRVNAYRSMRLAASLAPCVPSFELCGNGIDDDCDGLVDTLDPYCAPGTVPIGAACTRDFQCSVSGYCLEPSIGFPDGYCSKACEGTGSSCPAGSVCVGEGFTTGSSCHQSCVVDAECRAGYQCLPINPTSPDRACLPSCELSGCLPGETCNTTSGVCQHDGPSAIGDTCLTRVDCADNGRCLPDAQGFRDGLCVTECQDDGECPTGTACLQFGAGAAYCARTCKLPEDCREFYACNPIPGARPTSSVRGYCWLACLSASDCNYETCNEYGLCGDETPPDIEPAPKPSDDDKKDDGGCSAVAAEPLTLLALLALRRRSRARPVV